ncbi:chorismate synthase [Intestinimonas butyriciproducens]|uniref:chorismate synthase n=1 Tax=Intestinimonas butyriciproducens TaxID=1297617 RepID=UPI00195AA6A2|nr:chorismate synthase [Intestinimonas butyriciproducens]MBM6975684.1 chorismate synthase [Intestinimonas butyriciproducens]
MRYMIFGESHGPAIGVVLEGVPAGLALDLDFIRAELARRAPGQSAMTTARKEKDEPEILSGVFEGKTTGTPLCAVIFNTDTRSKDYAKLKDLPRPGHADYAGFVRYHGCNDYRGGGHFSGRLTAPLVFAGAVAKLALRQRGVAVAAHISNVAGIADPTPEEMEAAILAAKADRDSVGGRIRCAVTGLPAGLGAPDFGCNVEGIFSQYLFAVPAVKAVGFGLGTGFAALRGSQANDAFYMDGDTVRTRTNHTGGVNGGITNGMPVEFEVTIRPTPSIARSQDTVDLSAGTDAKLEITGRHDPCIVPRAVPVIESAAALATCELLGI